MLEQVEGDASRAIAWDRELRAVHERLRGALRVARATVDVDAPVAARDLLLYCHGFCVALGGHHRGEDRSLFPALSAAHPKLIPTIEKLRQDHAMIAHLLGGLQSAVDEAATPSELARHLEGLAAIMESHFRYEERELLDILATLDLPATSDEVFGPL